MAEAKAMPSGGAGKPVDAELRDKSGAKGLPLRATVRRQAAASPKPALKKCPCCGQMVRDVVAHMKGGR